MSKQNSRTTKAIDESFKRDVDNVIHGQRDHLSHVAQKYYDAIIDAENATPTGIPTAVNYAGRTGCIKTKAAGEFECGTNGLGYVTFSCPTNTGPYSDRACGVYTDKNFAGSTLDVNAATVGVFGNMWGNAPYLATGLTAAQMSYRLVGVKIKVKPVSSATIQGGRLVLLEDPNHEDLAGLNFQTMNSFTYARGVAAVDLFGASKNEIVLNYHPKSREAYQSATDYMSPFQWTAHSTALTSGSNTPLVIAAKCAANTVFSFEIYAIWECRGRSVKNLKERIPDSRGVDLVFAACAKKALSGWVGESRHIAHSYYAAIWHAAAKMGDPVLKALKMEFFKDKKRTMSTIKSLLKVAGFASAA